jgi:hypothetical protein
VLFVASYLTKARTRFKCISLLLIFSYVVGRRRFQLKSNSSRTPFGPRNKLEESVTSVVGSKDRFLLSLACPLVEQREPVFGLWLGLPPVPPSELPLISCVPFLPCLSLSLSLSLLSVLSSLRLSLYFLSRIFLLYLPRHPPLSRSLTLDVIQVASKRTTGSSRRDSSLSLRLLAHLFHSQRVSLSALPHAVLSLLLPISSSIFFFSPEADLTFSLEHSPL